MKQLIISLVFATLSIFSDAQLNQIISEVYYSDDGTVDDYPEGFTTYRIYALLEDSSDFLKSVSGSEDNELSIGSSTNTIWNSNLGGVTGPELNIAVFSTFPVMEYDSFVTVGRANNSNPGAQVSVFENGTDLVDGFGTSGLEAEFDTNVTVSAGTWYTSNGGVNGLGLGDENRVLLAQITTDGTLTYCINIRVYPLGVMANSITYYNLCDTDISYGCMQSAACNYDPYAVVDDGSCEYLSCLGCMDSLACNYDSNATEEDGSCEYLSCLGCTDSLGCNYNSTATMDDDSCEYESCYGCMDSEACNYDSTATIDNLLCDYSCYGCTDSIACNYDSMVTLDDGTCDFESCAGCMDPVACNFDSTATLEDFSCEYQYCSGCMDTTASNFDSTASIADDSCVYCTPEEGLMILDMTDSFGDGWNDATFTVFDESNNEIVSGTLESGFNDFIEFCAVDGCYSISVGGGSSDYEITWSLLNQEDAVIFENESSTGGVAIGFPVGDAVCPIDGCMDNYCLNYNPYATNDDGSCICPPENNDCQNAISIQDGDIILGTTINATDNEGLIGSNCEIPIEGPGVWYVYYGDGNQVTIQTCNTMPIYDTKISVFEGTCGALTCVIGNDDYCGEQSLVSYSTTVGVDLYILVHGPNMNSGNFQIDVNSLLCDSPTNDECLNAETLTSGNGITAELCCSQPDDASVCIGEITSYGVWYTFNSGDAETIDFDLSNVSGTNVGMVIYTVDSIGIECDLINPIACCPLVEGTCAGDISSFYTISPNTTFYLLVYTSDPVNCGNFDLTYTDGYLGCTDPSSDNYDSTANVDDGTCIWSNPPPNDDCSNAILLDCNTITLGSTGGALTGGPTELVECLANTNLGVWYSFTGTGELHNLSTCGSAEDTQVNVYTSDDGTCIGTFSCAPDGFGNFLSEIDDASFSSGCGLYEQDDVYIDFISVLDENYFIFVSSGGTTGGHQISISCDTIFEGCMDNTACNFSSSANFDDGSCTYQQSNDNCSGAIDITSNINGDNVFGVISECSTQSGMDPSCGGFYSPFDAFYSFTYNGGDVTIEVLGTGSLDDSRLAVWDACGGTVIACNDDGGEGLFSMLTVACPDLTIGNTYIVQVGGYSDTNTGSFELQITQDDIIGEMCLDPESPCYDSCATTWNCDCDYDIPGCLISYACNYNPEATSDDGSCEYDSCSGCMDSMACNYTSTSSIDDGSCDYSCYGCTDSLACNYDSTASINDESCEYSGDLSLSPDLEICFGDSVTLIASGGVQYFWDGVELADSLSVWPSETTEYTLLIVEENACETSLSTTVTVNPIPSPEFTQNANVLTGTAGMNYQWYLNGVPIDGATNQNYTILESGDYSLEIVNSYGCMGISEEVFVMYTGIDENSESQFMVYPNPSSTSATVQFIRTSNYEVSLLSSSGQIVKYFENIQEDRLFIPRENLAQGTYILKIVDLNSKQVSELKVVFE